MQSKETNIPGWLIPFGFSFYLVLNIISWRFPFFWDTLLTSTITNWFYENGWHGGIPTNDIDAGHPTLFYSYLLGWWKLFGTNLTVSHLAMLPFLWVMVYQFIQLGSKVLHTEKALIVATILFCLETTIIAQSTMVSYDILILCFYIFGLRYIIEGKKLPVLIVGIILSLISIRGVVAFGALFLTEWILFSKQRPFFTIIQKYIPAAMVFCLWNWWHLHQSGWMLFATSEQWADQRGFTTLNGMIGNVIAIIRVHLEPGRLLLYGFLFIGLIQVIRIKKMTAIKHLLVITLIPLILFVLFMVPFNNPIGHRYFMITFALSLLLFAAISSLMNNQKIWAGLTALCLISGHFWYSFYPSSVSLGWDSSLAHTQYFKVRSEMWHYLDEAGIPIEATSTHFPLDASMHQSRLNGDKRRPQEFELKESKYVLLSNICNDFEMNDYIELNEDCELLKHVSGPNTFIKLFECAK